MGNRRCPDDSELGGLFEERSTTIQKRFDRYHAAHPEVYAELVKIARQMKSTGRSHYGIGAIFEVVRFHRDLKNTEENGYKMSNDLRSRYARKIMDQERDLDGFFTLRELRTL